MEEPHSWRLSGHTDTVRTLCWLEEGQPEPLLASGSRHQFIKLFDLSALRDGSGAAARETHTIRYFDGFLGARIGPVSALCFHPSKTMLAVGATDSVLSLFGTPSR